MTKMAPEAQAGDGNIQDMLPVACEKNTNGTHTTATAKSDYFDKKNESSSAPSLKNGRNNYVSSRETAENSAKCVVGLTIITGESSIEDVSMDVVHVVQSDSTRERNFSKFQ